jgi:hypothetical protein
MHHGLKQANGPASLARQKADRTKGFNLFRISAYLGIVLVFAGLVIWNYFDPKWASLAMTAGIKAHAVQFAQFCTILLLTIRWVIATDREFHLWMRELEIPVENWQAYVAILALSLGLGASIAFSFDILWLTGCFSMFLLANYWSQWLSNKYFRTALNETRKQFKNEKRPNLTKLLALDVMEQYWLKKAQLARITTMLFFSTMAFSLAFAACLNKTHKYGWFQSAAGVLLILTILTGEIVIAIWRQERNKNIVLALAPNSSFQLKSKKRIDKAKADENDIKNLSGSAYVLIYAIAIPLNISYAMFSAPPIPSEWNIQALLYLAAIVLFLECLVLSFRWVSATKKELNLWIYYLVNPVDKDEVTLAIIGLGVTLGVMLAFTYAIRFISFFITLYFGLNYWTQWLSNDHFDRALQRTRSGSVNTIKEKVLNVMEQYWLVRPQMARIVTLMFFSAIAFSLALAGGLQPEPQKTYFFLASYSVLFVDILTGEIFMFWWRRDRDKKIDMIE